MAYSSLTKYIVLFSIAGSLASYYTLAQGWGEVYPFYTFKLFSQPLGTHNTYTDYRIYSRSSKQENFRRNEVIELKSYSKDDYSSTLTYLAQSFVSDSLNKTLSKKKLLRFINYVAPDAIEYKVVSETYHPLKFFKTGSYDTATVVSF